nr:hypothetical protein [Tanacetum cinerariifolium]
MKWAVRGWNNAMSGVGDGNRIPVANVLSWIVPRCGSKKPAVRIRLWCSVQGLDMMGLWQIAEAKAFANMLRDQADHARSCLKKLDVMIFEMRKCVLWRVTIVWIVLRKLIILKAISSKL